MPLLPDSFNKILLDHIAEVSVHYGTLHYSHYYDRTPRRSDNEVKDRGEGFVRDILASPTLYRSVDAYRMPPRSFLRLLGELQTSGGLKDGRTASATQKLAIFLTICGQGVSQRHAGEVYGHDNVQIGRSD